MFALTRTFPLDRLFEELYSERWTPAVDFVETADQYEVRVDLPGVDPAKVELKLEDNRLELRGEIETAEDERFLRRERRRGAFARVVSLPSDVDASAIRAESRYGVLTVMLPKREEAKARTLDIRIN